MATTITTKGVLYINDKPVKNSFKNIRTITSKLRQELRKLPVGTEAFRKKAEELKRAEKRFAAVSDEIKSTRAELNKTGNAFTRFWGSLGSFGNAFAGYQIFSVLKTGAKQLISDLIDISDAITNVEKTSGLATKEVGELWHQFSELDTRTSKMDLMKIAEIGGRLGITGQEELKAFTESIDKAYVALGDSFEGGLEAVTTQMGKLKNLFSETSTMDYPEALNRIGSALNELAANGTASEQNITDFATRIGQLPDALKPSAAQVLGLGAAFEESGEDARIAASGYSRFIVQASENVDAFAYSMNMGVEEAKELLNTHPEEFFLRFSEGMNGLDATQTATIFKDLKLNTLEIQKSVGAAGKNASRFREMMQLSAQAMGEATSLTNEFNKKNNNSAAIWTKIWKGIKEFVTDGAVPEFFDWLSNAFGWITGVASEAGDGIKNFRERLGLLVKVVAVAVVGLISYKTTMKIIALRSKEARQQELLYTLAVKAKTAATNIAHAAMALYGATIKFFSGNIKAARYEMIFFNNAIKMNPVGFWISAITIAISAIGLFSSTIEDNTESLEKQTKALRGTVAMQSSMAKEAEKSTTAMKNSIDPLIKILKDENATLDLRKRAYESLIAIYPEFKGTVDDEYIATENLANMYETLSKRIKETAIARGMKKSFEEAGEQLGDAQSELYARRLAKDKEEEQNKRIRKGSTDLIDDNDLLLSGTGGTVAGNEQTTELKESTEAANAYAEQLVKVEELQKDLNDRKGMFDSEIQKYKDQLADIQYQLKLAKEDLNNAKDEGTKQDIAARIAELKEQEITTNIALQELTGISSTSQNKTPGGGGSTPNRKLNDSMKSSIKARENAEKQRISALRKLQDERLAMMEDGEAKELEKTRLHYTRKIEAQYEHNEKIRTAWSQSNEDIAKLQAQLSAKGTSAKQKEALNREIENIKKAQQDRVDIVRTHNTIVETLEKAHEDARLTIKEKYRLKYFEDLAKQQKQKIQAYKSSRETEIIDIDTLEQAKLELSKNTHIKLSEQELSGIKSLEEAKKILREEANEEVLAMSLASLKAQKEILEKMLPSLTGEAAEKMKEDLLALNEAINKVKASRGKGGKPEGNEEDSSALGNVDILGFSAEQWKETFSNLETTSDKLAAVGMAFKALGNAAQMYAQHQQNLNDREWLNFKKNQDKKQKLLSAQLNAGLITQEKYHNGVQQMEAAADAKKRELALKQAKAEKAARMFSIIGDTAAAVVSALTAGPIAGPILAALVGTLGAAQLAIVAGQQLPQYHKGGYVNGLGFKDNTGHEVAGVVHSGEYVIPHWLMDTPEVANVAEWIENKRQGNNTRGYEDGGYTASKEGVLQIRQSEVDPNATNTALSQALYQLTDVLEDMQQNGVDAFIISDAKNGRQMQKAIKEFKRIQDKNKQ